MIIIDQTAPNKHVRRWRVVYSHCSGDVATTERLSHRRAINKLEKLCADPQFLDFAFIVWEPKSHNA